jgi:hypothetical protein
VSALTGLVVQRFDWLKDVTPEEETLMKRQGWDVEDANFAPVDKRYAQPALNLPEEDHLRAIKAARDADNLAKAFASGKQVCRLCQVVAIIHLKTMCIP